MNLSRRKIRLLLFHEFCLGCRATKATNNICSRMGEDMLSIRTGQHWFNRFKNSNLELDDLPHSGRPLELIVDRIRQSSLPCDVKTSEWIRQDMEFGHHVSCNTALIFDISPQLSMTLQSYHWQWEVGVVHHRRQWLNAGEIDRAMRKSDLHPKKWCWKSMILLIAP